MCKGLLELFQGRLPALLPTVSKGARGINPNTACRPAHAAAPVAPSLLCEGVPDARQCITAGVCC